MEATQQPSICDPIDLIRKCEQAQKKLLQLNAMLGMTYGEPGELFRAGGADDQGNYMWLCSDLATDCQELVDEILNECSKRQARRTL